MGRAGRPVAELVLTEQERETLQRWARRLKSSQALAQRCRIVLGCAAGKSNKEVATEVGVWSQTVCKWRQRFVESRLEGLADEPRPGAPRTITDEQIEEVIVATLERQPSDATHWSRASMATEAGLSKSTVGRIWKAFGLKPHQIGTFKISNDPQFMTRYATSSVSVSTRRRGKRKRAANSTVLISGVRSEYFLAVLSQDVGVGVGLVGGCG
jgi:transposase